MTSRRHDDIIEITAVHKRRGDRKTFTHRGTCVIYPEKGNVELTGGKAGGYDLIKEISRNDHSDIAEMKFSVFYRMFDCVCEHFTFCLFIRFFAANVIREPFFDILAERTFAFLRSGNRCRGKDRGAIAKINRSVHNSPE